MYIQVYYFTPPNTLNLRRIKFRGLNKRRCSKTNIRKISFGKNGVRPIAGAGIFFLLFRR